MLTPTLVILSLKTAVTAVTILLCLSLIALYRGNVSLHGKINMVFFILTLGALFIFEVVTRMLDPMLFQSIWKDADLSAKLRIHLMFALPSAILMGVMLFTGVKHKAVLHKRISWLFLICWTGTFLTGIFWLPNQVKPASEVTTKVTRNG